MVMFENRSFDNRPDLARTRGALRRRPALRCDSLRVGDLGQIKVDRLAEGTCDRRVKARELVFDRRAVLGRTSSRNSSSIARRRVITWIELEPNSRISVGDEVALDASQQPE